ncbi:MAG: polysaccharide pyruvyl transferase family protein [Sphingomonas sp.]
MIDRAERRRLRIGLLWHSASSGNLGVGALTVANLSIARGVAQELGLDAEFVILGMRDGDTPPVTGPDVPVSVIDMRALLTPGGYWRTVGRLDVVLDIGAGDSFADIYASKRFFMIWLTKVLTVAHRVPLVLSPQTIGPFTRAPYKQLAGAIMNHATAVVARDTTSLQVIRTLSPKARGVLAADVAFVLPFESRAAERGGATTRVGVNVSGLLFEEAERGTNRFGLALDYAAFTRRLLRELAARPGVEVHLVAHATSATDPADDDGALADRLAAEFPGVVRVPNFAGPSEAKTYISGLDFLIASRMHACIAAFSTGTPVVPVAYSRKFEGVFGLLGYDWLVPVKGLSEDAAIAYLLDALDRRAELAADEARGMEKVNLLLEDYRAILRETFTKAMRR